MNNFRGEMTGTMDNRIYELFDLAALIRHGELNIMHTAALMRGTTAGEYFEMLADLVRNAPGFLNDLQKIINREGDRDTFRRVFDMKTLLYSLGYEKHEIDFKGLLDSYERGFISQAVIYARKITDDFTGLYTRIKAARVAHPPAPRNGGPGGVLLIDWIERQSEEEPCRKPVVIAVDDSPVILKSVASALGREYKTYTLLKPAMLEKTLSHIKPDLFLLDYNMPELNGFELIPIIRSFAEHKATPIMFLTSEGLNGNLPGAVLYGACDFITKPVQPEILRSKIARHIDVESRDGNGATPL